MLEINVDKMIDRKICPEPSMCPVATTSYDDTAREHLCYICWKQWCKKK